MVLGYNPFVKSKRNTDRKTKGKYSHFRVFDSPNKTSDEIQEDIHSHQKPNQQKPNPLDQVHFKLDPSELVLSAVKKSKSGEIIFIRLRNQFILKNIFTPVFKSKFLFKHV